jgi:glyoxylase-like metal-dependent hydrolase (beta-lactamase superfamily II)
MLVDAGSKNQQQPFIRHLEKLRISAETIGLIVVTHIHFDHVGSLKAIKEMCGCPVAVDETESQLLMPETIFIDIYPTFPSVLPESRALWSQTSTGRVCVYARSPSQSVRLF